MLTLCEDNNKVNIKGFTKTNNIQNKYKIAYLRHLNEIKHIVILKKTQSQGCQEHSFIPKRISITHVYKTC